MANATHSGAMSVIIARLKADAGDATREIRASFDTFSSHIRTIGQVARKAATQSASDTFTSYIKTVRQIASQTVSQQPFKIAGNEYRDARDKTKMYVDAVLSPAKFRDQWRVLTQQQSLAQRMQLEASKSRDRGRMDIEGDASTSGGGGTEAIQTYWSREIFHVLETIRDQGAGLARKGGAAQVNEMSMEPPVTGKGALVDQYGKQIVEAAQEGVSDVGKTMAAPLDKSSKGLVGVIGSLSGVVGVTSGIFTSFTDRLRGVFNNAWAALGFGGMMSRILAPVGKTLMNVIGPALMPLQKFFIDLILNTVAPFIYSNMPAIMNFFQDLTKKAIPAIRDFTNKTLPLIISALKQIAKLAEWLVEHPKTAIGAYVGWKAAATVGTVAFNLVALRTLLAPLLKRAALPAATALGGTIAAQLAGGTTVALTGGGIVFMLRSALAGIGTTIVSIFTGTVATALMSAAVVAGSGVLIGWAVSTLFDKQFSRLSKKLGVDWLVNKVTGAGKAAAYAEEAGKDVEFQIQRLRQRRMEQEKNLNLGVVRANEKFGENTKFGMRPTATDMPNGVPGFTWPAEMQGTPFKIQDAPALIGPSSQREQPEMVAPATYTAPSSGTASSHFSNDTWAGLSKPAASPVFGEIRDAVGDMNGGLSNELRGLRSDLRRALRSTNDPVITNMMMVAAQ